MRITLALYKQHLYRMIGAHWKVQRKRIPIDLGVEKKLTSKNIEVVNALNVIEEERKPIKVHVVGFYEKQKPLDENHPLYHDKPCYFYRDHNVLLDGLQQAKVLTNTVEISPGSLPDQIENIVDAVKLPNQDSLVQRCIQSSFIYDAEQKKLPIRRDPDRPAWIFPRDYGITDSRKNRTLCSRLLQLCEMANSDLSEDRGFINNAAVCVPLEVEDLSVQLELRADILVTAAHGISPIMDPESANNLPLPDISPLHQTVSLEAETFYELRDIFPLKHDTRLSNAHTIFVHFNGTEVGNLYETDVLDTQIEGRSLLKCYAFAVGQARFKYGTSAKKLPEPIVVQCVHTDGQMYHFCVLQLNTLSLTGDIRNVFWSLPVTPMFNYCGYNKAIPTLEEYNPDVFKRILALYNNSGISVK